MKLVRFERLDDLRTHRAGFFQGGKIYETDGQNPIAVHELDQLRLLPPIHPPTIRIFDASGVDHAGDVQDSPELVPFAYANSYALHGPNAEMAWPDYVHDAHFKVYLAAVSNQGSRVSTDEADAVIIGFTLLLSVYSKTHNELGRSAHDFDFGLTTGPVLTTPDELEENIIDETRGNKYSIPYIIKHNGIESARGTTAGLPISVAQAIEVASSSVSIQSGDLIAVGPIHPPTQISLSPGDELSVSADKLGTLTVRIVASKN